MSRVPIIFFSSMRQDIDPENSRDRFANNDFESRRPHVTFYREKHKPS